jgi:pimeloyl-ACP methyl ester carboxylesterase
MSGLTKIFKVRSRDLKNPVEGLETEKRNRIVIERDILPIIFVPGIMGSRLKNQEGKTVWDPDYAGFMLLKYGGFWISAKNRKQRIIGEKFDPSYLEVFNDDPEHNKVLADPHDKKRDKRGWGGVYWNSCGEFLKKLQTRQWDQTVNLFFEFPVHVFGYNWTASNDLAGQKLAAEIDRVIQLYRDMGRYCDYVILVTHSMGGLVARSACMREGVKDKVLGIVHAAQPSEGSPAAYWRMKGGFERPHSVPDMDIMQWFKNPVKAFKHKKANLIQGEGIGIPFTDLKISEGKIAAWILGTDGEEVTALLGNMPGGLELLPNKHYKSNDGEPGWLELIDSNGNKKALPKMDPYNEIYREQELYYRLVNPDWLNPGTKNETAKLETINDPLSSWGNYLDCLTQAETFHENLAAASLHPETYQYYASGIASADRVVFTSVDDTLLGAVKRKLGITEGKISHKNSLVFKAEKGAGVIGKPVLIEMAGKLLSPSVITDTDWYQNRGGYRDRVNDQGIPSKDGDLQLVTMQLPDGAGDGTVPESSAMALELPTDTQRTFCIADRHEFEGSFVGRNQRLKPKHPPDFDEGYFDRGHEPVLNTSSARFITFTVIENICRGEIRRLLKE